MTSKQEIKKKTYRIKYLVPVTIGWRNRRTFSLVNKDIIKPSHIGTLPSNLDMNRYHIFKKKKRGGGDRQNKSIGLGHTPKQYHYQYGKYQYIHRLRIWDFSHLPGWQFVWIIYWFNLNYTNWPDLNSTGICPRAKFEACIQNSKGSGCTDGAS